MPDEEIYKLDKSTVFMRDDGLLQVDMHTDVLLEVEDAKQIVEAEGKLGGRKKLPALHIVGKHLAIGTGVREYSANEGTAFTSAEAYVINSLAHKILGNFYTKVNKPAVPTRMFSNEEEAVKWLLTFL